MDELIRILTDIRDERDVAGNNAYKIGDALLRLQQFLSETSELVDDLSNKVSSDDHSTYLKKEADYHAGQYRLSLAGDGNAYVELKSAEGSTYDEKNVLYNKTNFMAQLINIPITDLTQINNKFVTPPIQLLIGNAQVQITTSTPTTVTVARSNAPFYHFDDIPNYSDVATPGNNTFNISGGVAGMYIKLIFSEKPTSISILS